MYHLPLTLETPAANLALDEALLDEAERGALPGDVLRLWEPAYSFIVLGRSSAVSEVQLDACRADGVPVLRRASGGGTVVAGPGCLMFALVLHSGGRPELGGVDRIHRFVLDRLATACTPLAAGVVRAGTSDLALRTPSRDPPRKFAGNSLRIRRRAVLYHGAILYNFPLEQITRWLGPPTREPDYRGRRSHEAFLTNLPASRAAITTAIVAAWQATKPLAAWPQAQAAELAATRYASIEWSAGRGASRD